MNININDVVYHQLTWRLGFVEDIQIINNKKTFLINFYNDDERYWIETNLEIVYKR